jgi:hypothetical protein
MAKIIPIDVIKGISGKYGSGSNDYFVTNSSSNKVHLAKLVNPYTGPASEKQVAQQKKFAARQAVATAWLNANKPSELNGAKGTEEYQLAQRIKRANALSCVTQVIHKYMDGDNTINLPKEGSAAKPSVSPQPEQGGNAGGSGSSQGSGSGDNGGGSEV